jgi:hypothetical protein
MVFVILGFIIGIFYGEDLFGGFLGAVFGLIIYGIAGSFIGCALPTIEHINTQNIVAMNDSSKIEGQKYLFSGYVDEKLVYRYIVETDKGKHIEECSTENGYLKEGNTKKPYAESHSFKFKQDWYYWFAININSADNYSVFYVPKGTVTNKYNVDLQ